MDPKIVVELIFVPDILTAVLALRTIRYCKRIILRVTAPLPKISPVKRKEKRQLNESQGRLFDEAGTKFDKCVSRVTDAGNFSARRSRYYFPNRKECAVADRSFRIKCLNHPM